jgi:hypothetical protein
LSGPDVVAWDDPTKRNAKLSPGGSVHDPTDPVGRLLLKVLAIRLLATGNARKSTLYRAAIVPGATGVCVSGGTARAAVA